MTAELESIYAEIMDLHDESDDLQMLEALINNAVYVLSKMQQSPKISLLPKEKEDVEITLSDLLNTLSKEFRWAKEEEEDLLEQHRWFVKAKKQFLVDMKPLFNDNSP